MLQVSLDSRHHSYVQITLNITKANVLRYVHTTFKLSHPQRHWQRFPRNLQYNAQILLQITHTHFFKTQKLKALKKNTFQSNNTLNKTLAVISKQGNHLWWILWYLYQFHSGHEVIFICLSPCSKISFCVTIWSNFNVTLKKINTRLQSFHYGFPSSKNNLSIICLYILAAVQDKQ